jgi:hypothetical protein
MTANNHVINIKNNLINFVLYLQMTDKWHQDDTAACAINAVLDESVSNINDYKQRIILLAGLLRDKLRIISDQEYDTFFKNINSW